MNIFLLAEFDIGDIFDNFVPRLVEISVQLIATAIALLILWRFLWKPAKAMIKKRQDYIDQQVAAAALEKQEATVNLEQAKGKLDEAKKRYEKIIDDANEEAQVLKREIIKDGENQKTALLDKAHRDIVNEGKEARKQLRNEIVDIAILTAERIIEKKIDHDEINDSFLKEIK